MWLRNNCRYSLNVGKLPAGEDFAEYFLEERRGSCSHFATAAVLMCRYAGIPARYVEGYVIKPSDFPDSAKTGSMVSVDVTDARGHAWVEIYIDGFGWYPMEFTSGYGNVRTALPTETTITETEETVTETEVLNSETAESETVSAANTGNNNVQPENSGTEISAEASDLQTTYDISETEVTAFPSISEESIVEKREPSVGFGIFGIKAGRHSDIVYDLTVPFVILIAIILIPVTVVLRRRIVIMMYRRKCSLGNKSAVFASYKRFGMLLQFMKLPRQDGLDYDEYAVLLSERSHIFADGMADTVINTALKASFGGMLLTENEAEEMVSSVNTIMKRYYLTLSNVKKFVFKYLYCMI